MKKAVLAKKWTNQEAPQFNGMVCANGKFFEVGKTGLSEADNNWENLEWVNVAVLAQKELYGGTYLLKCGEAFEHGSIGVVILEDLSTHQPIWIFVSHQSNPFDEVVLKGSRVLVISTTGAVLSFRVCPVEAEIPFFDIFYYEVD